MQGLMMDYQLTLDRILEHANRMFPHKHIRTKLPDGSFHSYTYADLYRRVKRLANVLEGLGIEPGDCVGTFAWNNYQHLELYYGIPGAGAICHTLNIRLAADQLAYIINHAEDKVIFVDGTLLPLFEKLAGQIDTVKHIVLINAAPGTTANFPNVHHYEALMAAADEEYTWRCTDEQMAMGLCYTSGTTGDPKGALYSHRSMFLHAIGICMATSLGITERDVVLPVVPQFHVMAWGLPFACVYVGAELIMPGPHLQPAPLAEMIEDHRVSIAAGVPTIWMGLYQELKSNPRDISCIRALVVGGSAMPRSLTERYEDELGVNVVHAWGMTEMSPLGTVCNLQRQHLDLPHHEQLDLKAKQGYIVPGVEMRIVNEAGKELPWDGTTMGEVQVRGPWIIRSYFKREPNPENFTDDGWFRTGDVATITADGYMEITDRTKDLIKSGGEWISSVALENTLMAHPKVAEAAVIAMPDAKWSERPLAVVVRAPDVTHIDTQELLDYLTPNFARFWLPDRIVQVDSIPKTSVGKFDKKRIRQQLAEGALG
ncbi:MAG: long-chain fatty acid--CoA ligase [Caldilineaceae bacterium]|nr:long-chain fatty acid--CoA ligase [Caldilineaceae bacterium]